MSKKSFHVAAVDSFERTFRAIFKQADEEVDRLDRINSAMGILETQLLDPERIGDMDTMQQIALMELLSRSQQATIRNIMGFSGTLSKIRNVVGIYDGIQAYTALPESPTGEFPELDVDNTPQLECDKP